MTVVVEKHKGRLRVSHPPLPPLQLPTTVGSFLDALISHVSSAGVLWVQLPEKRQSIEDIGRRLGNATLTRIESNVAPWEDSLVAVQLGFDRRWYRAVILARIDAVNTQVHLVDYGNTETVDHRALRRIPPALANIPGQSIPLGIANLPEMLQRSLLQSEYNQLVDVRVTCHIVYAADTEHALSLEEAIKQHIQLAKWRAPRKTRELPAKPLTTTPLITTTPPPLVYKAQIHPSLPATPFSPVSSSASSSATAWIVPSVLFGGIFILALVWAATFFVKRRDSEREKKEEAETDMETAVAALTPPPPPRRRRTIGPTGGVVMSLPPEASAHIATVLAMASLQRMQMEKAPSVLATTPIQEPIEEDAGAEKCRSTAGSDTEVESDESTSPGESKTAVVHPPTGVNRATSVQTWSVAARSLPRSAPALSLPRSAAAPSVSAHYTYTSGSTTSLGRDISLPRLSDVCSKHSVVSDRPVFAHSLHDSDLEIPSFQKIDCLLGLSRASTQQTTPPRHLSTLNRHIHNKTTLVQSLFSHRRSIDSRSERLREYSLPLTSEKSRASARGSNTPIKTDVTLPSMTYPTGWIVETSERSLGLPPVAPQVTPNQSGSAHTDSTLSDYESGVEHLPPPAPSKATILDLSPRLKL